MRIVIGTLAIATLLSGVTASADLSSVLETWCGNVNRSEEISIHTCKEDTLTLEISIPVVPHATEAAGKVEDQKGESVSFKMFKRQEDFPK